MTELAIGHFCRFYTHTDTLKWSFQNFYINQTPFDIDGVSYSFVPFGFSGLSASREGELSPTALVFPSNDLARGYLSEALRGGTLAETAAEGIYRPYVVEVDVNILKPDSTEVITKLLTYTGQCTAGGWNDTTLQIELSSVLDAATAEIPARTLQQKLVGQLPLTSSVNLR